MLVNIEHTDIFQKEHKVLGDVNLSVNPGELLFLIGKNGSGKSSLLKILYAELKLKVGKGEVASFDLTKIKRKSIPLLRRKIGIVFQDFKLLTDRTVNENLRFVMKATGWKNKKEIDQRIDEVLGMVKLSEKKGSMPHELSGGEQQRIAIARALINEPELILADEPTGNLDPNTSKDIMQILHDIRQSGKAVIMASHDFDLIKMFPSRIVKCENGQMTELNEVPSI